VSMELKMIKQIPFRVAVLGKAAAAAIVILAAIATAPVHADGNRERLEAFVSNTTSFTARFQQTLYDADSSPLQTSTGTIQLKRPGRFVWQYETPNRQQLLSDGDQLWLYDEELEQVTVNALSDKVGGTPLVLLMGTRPLDEEFDIKALGPAEGIEWFELIPKQESADFESLFIGLSDIGLSTMELRDNFGQATQIRFTDMNPGAALDDSLFIFKAPAGVDIIGQ